MFTLLVWMALWVQKGGWIMSVDHLLQQYRPQKPTTKCVQPSFFEIGQQFLHVMVCIGQDVTFKCRLICHPACLNCRSFKDKNDQGRKIGARNLYKI